MSTCKTKKETHLQQTLHRNILILSLVEKMSHLEGLLASKVEFANKTASPHVLVQKAEFTRVVSMLMLAVIW